MIKDNLTKLNFEQKIINAILLLGVTLSLVQFIYNRSLWRDEAALALNIINKNGLELLKPLDYMQVAPILFLQLEKLFSILLPNSEYGLRLLPLLCFWFSLYFFYRILKLTFKNYYSIIFALSLFVFNYNLIYYSSEVKQYICDVLVLTSIYYFTLKSYKREESKYYLLGILGCVSIYLSNVTPIILFSCGIYLFYNSMINKKIYFKYMAGVSIVWVITFLSYYYYFIHGHPIRDYMVSYWSNAFMPHNLFSTDFYLFLVDKFKMLFDSPYGIMDKILFPILYLIGFVTLSIRRKTDILLIMLIPIFLHLLLSAFKLYPFDVRLIIYIIPVVIIITSFGFEYLIDIFFTNLRIERFRLLAILIPLSLLFVLCSIGFPQQHEEIKKTINYIENNINKNDKIYVNYFASNAFKYYSDIQFMHISAPILNGSKNCNNNEKYINELKNLKGRNWLLFVGFGDNDTSYIIRNLDSLGYNKIETFITYGSSTYLYDFRD
jgi:hypothetical protein